MTSVTGTRTIQATYTNEKKCAAHPIPKRWWSTVAGSWPRKTMRSNCSKLESHRLRLTNGTKLLRFRKAA